VWYKSYTGLRLHFDLRKSRKLRSDPRRGIGFEEAEEIFRHTYFLSYREDDPEQYCATGWVKGRLYSLIFEIRQDEEGEYYHAVTLWKATQEEKAQYEANL